MKKLMKTITPALAFSLLAGGIFSPYSLMGEKNIAFAQQSSASCQQVQRQVRTRPKQNVAPQMTPETFKIFEQVQIEIDEENYGEAQSLVETLLSRKGLSNYEMAMGFQMRGFVAYLKDDYNTAIREYMKILQTPDIPYATADSIRYTVAQLLSMQGRFQESLKELDEWFLYQPNPTPMQFFFKSQVHYQYGLELDKNASTKAQAVQQFKIGIVEVEQAICMAKADPTIDVLENWYQIESALYFQIEDYEKVRDVLEIMIVKWPRPAYWVQLSAMYSELKQYEEQLAVLDVAYRLGFLEKEANIVTIAQLYSINGLPYLSAKVLEKGMNTTKVVDGKKEPLVDPKDEKNLTLLGQSYLVGKDFKLSTEPLNKAAELAKDGKLYLQLGSVYSTLEDWKNAASSLQKAIEKGKLDDLEQAYLYLGLAYVNFREFTKAEEAFKNAQRVGGDDAKVRKTVAGWMSYIAAEKQRLKRLAAAGITPG